ncbi:MAG: endo-1,4-beta-xylanase [Candidatus Hydrogenedentota bacterium]
MNIIRLVISFTLITAITAGAAQAISFEASNASIKQSPEGHLLSNGEVAEYIEITEAGVYALDVTALGQPLDGVWPIMALSVDGYTADEVSVNTETWEQYVFETWFDPGVYTIGVQFLNDAMSETEDRNLGLTTLSLTGTSGEANPAFSTESAWLADAERRELDLVDATTEQIKELRMGGATVYVVDAEGNPVPNASVTVEQDSHEFLFGASFAGYETFFDTTKNAKYEELFSDVFNYATLPLFWGLIEPTEGNLDFARLDSMVDWCVDNDIAMKGHALLWTQADLLPNWMNGELPSEEEMHAHVATLMQRYGDRIGAWEVVNEPHNQPGISLDAPHTWARDYDPDGKLVVNEYGQFYNGLLGFWDHVAAAQDRGVAVDAVGIQGHAPTDTAYPMHRIRDILDLYAQLDVGVHITELTPPSDGTATTGAPWRSQWDEATQADYAEKLYRVAFAHPAVEAISWWDFSDHGAWVPSGGLVDENLNPKPAYNALKRLITEEWHTSKAGETYTGGGFYFNGYLGSYTVNVNYEGYTKEVTFTLTKSEENALTVTLDDLAPADPPAVTVNSLATKNDTPTLTGTVANAASVSVSVDGESFYRADIDEETWQIALGNALEDGRYDVQARATNDAGHSVDDNTDNELTVDTTAPAITLTGNDAIEIEEGESYTEPGYTASDNIDGDITGQVNVSGSVKTDVPDEYTIRYSVADSLGNSAEATRTVTVTAKREQVLVGVVGDLNNDGVIEEWDHTLSYYLNVWGEDQLNQLLRGYGMATVDTRLADINLNDRINSTDTQLLNWTLQYGLETVNDYLANQGQALCRVGEEVYE